MSRKMTEDNLLFVEEESSDLPQQVKIQQTLFLQGRDAMVSTGLQGDLDTRAVQSPLHSQNNLKVGSTQELYPSRNYTPDKIVDKDNVFDWIKPRERDDRKEPETAGFQCSKKNNNSQIDCEISVDVTSSQCYKSEGEINANQEEDDQDREGEEKEQDGSEDDKDEIQNPNKQKDNLNAKEIYEDDMKSGKCTSTRLGISFIMKVDKKPRDIIESNRKLKGFEKGKEIMLRVIQNSQDKTQRIKQKVIDIVKLMQRRSRNRSVNAANMSEHDWKLLNDRSHILDSHKEGKIFNRIKTAKSDKLTIVIAFLSAIYHLLLKIVSKNTYDQSPESTELTQIPLFQPTNLLLVAWDALVIAVTIILLFSYSMLMFFGQVVEYDENSYSKFLLCCLAIFIVDMFIALNTAFFDKDILVTNRSRIAAKLFLSHLFSADVICFLVISVKLLHPSSRLTYNPNHSLQLYFFNSLIFLKGFTLKRNRERFHYVFTLRESQRHLLSLGKQFFNLITIAHIASILWYMLGIAEEWHHYPQTWLKKASLLDEHFAEQYIYSMYWSITTMTTVGYGDIAATNSTEATFIAILLLVFSCVFAYSINNIGLILSEIQKSSKELHDNITTIQRYLNRKHVPTQLKSRVRHYLQFLADEQRDRDKDAEDYILGILSNKLRDEIRYEINSKIVNNFALFTTNFSSSTLRQITTIMEEVVVSPNEILFNQNDTDDAAIYFVQSGIIEICSQIDQFSSAVPIQSLSANNSFGEISFFSGLSRSASARSVNLSTLYKIKRNDFLQLLDRNKEDFERFKMIQEKILFQKDLKALFLQCFTCRQYGHIASYCWKTHQEFDRQKIILSHNFSDFQSRMAFSDQTQRKRERFHSLLLHSMLSQALSPPLRAQLQDIYNQNIRSLLGDQDHHLSVISLNDGEDERSLSFGRKTSFEFDDEKSRYYMNQYVEETFNEKDRMDSIQGEDGNIQSSKDEIEEYNDIAQTNQNNQNRFSYIFNHFNSNNNKSNANISNDINGYSYQSDEHEIEDAQFENSDINGHYQRSCEDHRKKLNSLTLEKAKSSQESEKKIDSSRKSRSHSHIVPKTQLQQSDSLKLALSSLRNAISSSIGSESNSRIRVGDRIIEQIPLQSPLGRTLIQQTPKTNNQNMKKLHGQLGTVGVKNQQKETEDRNGLAHLNSNSMQSEQGQGQEERYCLNTDNAGNCDDNYSNKSDNKLLGGLEKKQRSRAQSFISQINKTNTNKQQQQQIQQLMTQSNMTNGGKLLPVLYKGYEPNQRFSQSDIPHNEQKNPHNKHIRSMSAHKRTSLQTIVGSKLDSRNAEEAWRLCSQQVNEINHNIEEKGVLRNQLKHRTWVQQRLMQMGLTGSEIALLQTAAHKENQGTTVAGLKSEVTSRMHHLVKEESFEVMRRFSKFFPYNNYDKVLNRVKTVMIQQRKERRSQQKNRRHNFIFTKPPCRASFCNSDNYPMNQLPYDPVLYAPTYLSYGVSKRNHTQYPLIKHISLRDFVPSLQVQS